MNKTLKKRKAARLPLVNGNGQNIFLTFNHAGQRFEGKLWDYSRFGLGVLVDNTGPVIKKNNTVNEISLLAHGEERDLKDGTIAWKQKTEKGTVYGIFLTKEFVDLDFLLVNQKFQLHEDDRNEIRCFLEEGARIRNEFKSFASDFAYRLSIFKNKLDDFDDRFHDETPSLKRNLFQTVSNGIGEDLKLYLTRQMEQLDAIVSDFQSDEKNEHGIYLRTVLREYLKEAPFIERSITKPRGYAGDSMMMQMVYEDDYYGKTSFGKILHKHPLELASACAVRNRRRLINNHLNSFIETSPSENVSVLSVACGPAWEMQDFFRESPHKTKAKVYLLDQDEDALNEAKTGLSSIPESDSFQVQYLQESVRTLMRKRTHSTFENLRFNFVYSMGLFDYLTQPVCNALVRNLYELTAPGGLLLIGNYSNKSPDQNYLDFLLDWPLLYKSEENMLEMASGLSGEYSTEVGYEESGTQLFLKIVKGG